MLQLARRASLALALATLAACGGDDGSGPPPFPDVAGTYQISGNFTGVPNSALTGTLTLTQATRTGPQLGGQVSVSAPGLAGGAVTGLANAQVTENGQISFNVGSTGTSATSWLFTGTVSGRQLSGQHTLSSSEGSFGGPWSAVRP